MKRLLYQERYDHIDILDESFCFDEPPIFKRNKGSIDCDLMIHSVVEFSRFAQLDTDIYETDSELIFQFHFNDDFSLNDLGLPPFERILNYCDALSLKKSDDDLINGILELRYFK